MENKYVLSTITVNTIFSGLILCSLRLMTAFQQGAGVVEHRAFRWWRWQWNVHVAQGCGASMDKTTSSTG